MPISSPSRSEKPQTTCAHPLSPARSGIRRNRICGITGKLLHISNHVVAQCARPHNIPVFVSCPNRVPHLARYAERFPDIQFVIPYDAHCFDHVVPRLVGNGAHVVVPHLRGYGPTRFIDGETSRSGQQAALAADPHELIAALGVTAPVVAGFDWGGLRQNEYPIHTEIMAARGRRTAPAAAKATPCGL